MRSLKAAHLLKEMGFKKVKSLKGGIHAWATDVEPDMATY
jgi:rhodanese-related sulfurtransferase